MIGILGGYGNVGIFASRFLQKLSNHKLRIGGRNISKVSPEILQEFSSAEWMLVNANSNSDVEKFFEGCDCILDAAKLSESEAFRMDILAERLEIPVVHLGIRGFKPRTAKVPILYGAGSIPGLSGLIPQHLSKDFESVSDLNFCYGGLGSFSKSAAKDYLEGIFEADNHSMVFWNHGEIVPFAPSQEALPKIDELLPRHKKFPYFDEESALIAEKLNVQEGRWQMCICGERTLESLDSARFRYRQDPEKTVDELVRNSQLDCFGISENAIFECKISGILNGEEVFRKMALWGISPSEWTGEVAALATLSVLENVYPKNVLLFGSCDFSSQIIEALTRNDPRIHIDIQDSREEEGEI